MKAVVHERYGMPDVLELRDVELPTIEDHQVLLRVHAASVNPVEWYGVTGPVFHTALRRRSAQAEGARKSAPMSRGESRPSART